MREIRKILDFSVAGKLAMRGPRKRNIRKFNNQSFNEQFLASKNIHKMCQNLDVSEKIRLYFSESYNLMFYTDRRFNLVHLMKRMINRSGLYRVPNSTLNQVSLVMLKVIKVSYLFFHSP